ncbi:MAG TPA: PEP-CTERM sorting domain-containing protein [Terriglobia bacterium]
MKKLVLLAAVASFFAAQAAMAGTVVLTFDQLGNEEAVDNYYAGGFGGNGTGPGPNYGITFSSNSLAITSVDAGGSGNFNDNPSGNNIVFFLSGAADTMNVAGGFTTGFSFYYSAVVYPGYINVWSGLNDTGTLLASLDLGVTPEGGGTCNTAYCPWVPIGVSFDGTAQSVDFGGSANYIGFDNITLGASTPGGAAPEPASLMLFGSGLVGLASRIRRRRNRTAQPAVQA